MALAYPLLWLCSGLLILAAGSLVPQSLFPPYVFLFLAFLIFNLIVARVFSLQSRLRATWSARRVPFFVLGAIAGALPVLVVVLATPIQLNWDKFVAIHVVATLFIVGWEELWFRGAVLELAAQKYGKLLASSLFGFLFALMHIMNPDLNILHAAPSLFIGGYALCMAYFAFETIWFPIGMHFSYNVLEKLTSEPSLPAVATLIEFLLAVVFTVLVGRKGELYGRAV